MYILDILFKVIYWKVVNGLSWIYNILMIGLKLLVVFVFVLV